MSLCQLSHGSCRPSALRDHLRKGKTYRDLAAGFGVAASTAYRYLREALPVLAALAPTLAEAMGVAATKPRP